MDEARLPDPFHGGPPHETNMPTRVRLNVLFEASMEMVRDGNRVVLVELGAVRPFSDIGSGHSLRLNNSTGRARS